MRGFVRRLPWGLLGMLALVLLCESYVAGHRHRFMTPHELDWMTSGRLAMRSPQVRSAARMRASLGSINPMGWCVLYQPISR